MSYRCSTILRSRVNRVGDTNSLQAIYSINLQALNENPCELGNITDCSVKIISMYSATVAARV